MSFLVLVVDDESDVEIYFASNFGATSALAASPWILLNREMAPFNVSAMPTAHR